VAPARGRDARGGGGPDFGTRTGPCAREDDDGEGIRSVKKASGGEGMENGIARGARWRDCWTEFLEQLI
jgi:hypothetical protein